MYILGTQMFFFKIENHWLDKQLYRRFFAFSTQVPEETYLIKPGIPPTNMGRHKLVYCME